MRYLKESSSFLAISVPEAKEFLRVSHSSEDALIESLIKSATGIIEKFLNWDICDYTYTLILNEIPSEPIKISGDAQRFYSYIPSQIELKKIHVKSITEVKWVNKAGAESTFDPAKYHLFVDNTQYYLTLNESELWPTDLRSWDSFKIKFKVGYGSASEIDASLINSIKMVLTNLYEKRGEEGEAKVPESAFSLIHPFKVWR